MKIGLVCPYSLDVPGGVQAHVLDLARALLARGHAVDVLAPATGPVPEFVTRAGRALPVPYNGSVARVRFGPVALGRVRRWLARGDFDVLHVHEPTTPSVSVLALLVAEGPIVVTFHTATDRSRALTALGGLMVPLLEKVTARIAVSPSARRVQVRHLGGDAVEIPNGVDVAAFAGPRGPAGERVGFLGRFDEPRKGMPVLLAALARLAPHRPDLQLVVAGRGDPATLHAGRIEHLGELDEAAKAAFLRGVDVLVAPHTGRESFGMVLTEAMAAGTPVVAADLDAFAAVLDGAGVLFPAGDAGALAAELSALLDDPGRRSRLAAAGRARAARFAWPVVAAEVEQVYRAALAAAPAPRETRLGARDRRRAG